MKYILNIWETFTAWTLFRFFTHETTFQPADTGPYIILLPLKMLFLGVSVNRLFRAAADLLGECKRRVGGRRVLRRLQELPGPALHSRRVRHLFQNLPEGIPDGGHHHRLLHVRNRNYASSRWKYVFFSERKE